jgi:hypothetical protein
MRYGRGEGVKAKNSELLWGVYKDKIANRRITPKPEATEQTLPF